MKGNDTLYGPVLNGINEIYSSTRAPRRSSDRAMEICEYVHGVYLTGEVLPHLYTAWMGARRSITSGSSTTRCSSLVDIQISSTSSRTCPTSPRHTL
eukprot:7057248-Prymnesium_polylepis.1